MNPDDQISDLLKSWNHTPDVSAGFRRDVWSRIGSRQPERFTGWAHFLISPRSAILGGVIAILLGVVAGNLQARSSGETLYLRSADPLTLSTSRIASR